VSHPIKNRFDVVASHPKGVKLYYSRLSIAAICVANVGFLSVGAFL